MKPVTSAAQARALDLAFVERTGLPSLVLMESASRALAEHVRTHYPTQARRGIVVVCGAGNNGGDGYGAARWLASWGYPVRIWSLAGQSSGDAAAMRKACVQLGLPRSSGIEQAGVVIDAIFGTGLDRPITGIFAEVVQTINDAGSVVVSADLPSGLCAQTGTILGVAVRASSTVSFGTLKPGVLAEPGSDLCGAVEVADLGFGEVADRVAGVVEPTDLMGRWPSRSEGDHKNRSGHLLVVAGSTHLSGAASLTCAAALAAGAGLVTLATSAGAVRTLRGLPAEVMLLVVGEGDVVEPLPKAALSRRTALAAGPGLGNGVADLSGGLGRWLQRLWIESPMPMVFDADALPLSRSEIGGPRVVTPHPGEAGRLLGCAASEVQADRFGAARRLGEHYTAVLKGRHTLIATPDRPLIVNPTGNAVLASGGTGDVLTGVIGALLARGVSAPDAAMLGVWVHGRAADLLAQKRAHGWRATDVIRALPDAISELSA
ncbi:MAG: NAD(P)H-hydrate dehydratase [Deltaproteobacteria bacterium]|nr:MAG: NAD(P)H-hydrate dehydratase [Deltaproteobacteria bacterium]